MYCSPSPATNCLMFGMICFLTVTTGIVRAENVRIAVGDVQFKTADVKVADAAARADLWRSLLENALCEFDSVEVLERDEIASILKETQLSLSMADAEVRLRTQRLLGADFFVLTEMNADQKSCEFSVRLVSTEHSAVESSCHVKVENENMEEGAAQVAAELCKSAYEAIAGTRVVSLVAILDFENKSPLSRNDWLETAFPRRLRQGLAGAAGIRTLERQEMDLLLQEVRLGAGGFIDDHLGDTPTKDNSRQRFLVAGHYDEYQPRNETLHFEFNVLIQNIESRSKNTRRFTCNTDQLDEGVAAVVSFIEEQIQGKDAVPRQEGSRESDTEANPLARAMACLDDETAGALLDLDRRCKDEPRLAGMRDRIIKNIIAESERRTLRGGKNYESRVNLEKALAELGFQSLGGIRAQIDMSAEFSKGRAEKAEAMSGKSFIALEKLRRFLMMDNETTMWGFEYARSDAGFDTGYMQKLTRKTKLLRAVRLLKTAVMLDNDNVLAKELLCSILSDRQIGEVDLATELAHEIAARYPDTEHERGALHFLIKRYMSDVRLARPYVELLISKYPGRDVVRAIDMLTATLSGQKHIPLKERLRQSEEFMGIVFSGSQVSHDVISTQMRNWYNLTQSEIEYREVGENRVERLVADYPHLGAAICYTWSWCWDRRYWEWTPTWDRQPERNQKAIYWSKRGVELYGKRPPDDRNTGDWMLIGLKYRLGLNLFDAGQYAEAAGVFKGLRGAKFSRQSEGKFLEAVCAYQLGNHEEALAQFQEMGAWSDLSLVRLRKGDVLKTDADGKAEEWARRCREKLALQGPQTVTANPVPDPWHPLKIRLPFPRASALAWDGQGIWVGANARKSFDQMLSQYDEQEAAVHLKQYRENVVLVRFEPTTGETVTFRGVQLTSPWISSILVYNGRVWVGTEGGGLNVYDLRQGAWTGISDKQGLPSAYVQCVKPDGPCLWIGAGNERDGAIARYDLQSGSIHSFLPRDYPDRTAPPTCHVYDIQVAGGYVWFALGANGVARYDKHADTWSYFSKDLDGKITKQDRTSRYNSYLWYIESIALFNNRIWFASSRFQDPQSASRMIDFTLEDRAIFSCDLTGEDFRSLALKDGLPKAEVAAMQALGDRLFMGTAWPLTVGTWRVPGPCGLVIMGKEGDFRVFDATEVSMGKARSVGLEQILALENEVIAAFGNTLKILRYQ